MGSGNIVYKLTVPYKTIKDNSQAFTSFSQVGGWCYKSTLSYRKAHLQSVILKGEMLNINELKQTSEKPQEYWIQWRNKFIQVDCLNLALNDKSFKVTIPFF